MKHILILSALLSSQIAPAQQRFVNSDLGSYFDWFHARSQSDELYIDQTTLYVFSDKAALRTGPCQTSEQVHELKLGEPLSNISYNDEYYLPEDEINGYHDIWYHVTTTNAQGKKVAGYVWGGDIAKGWRTIDISGDSKAEFLMLGISSKERKTPRDINAEIRILSDGQLIALKTVPGLCVFEECDASALLRVYRTKQGFTIVETSTLTLGCWAGLEKAFHYWDGQQLQRVYHAEYLTDTKFADESFVVNYSSGTQLCQYSHEGTNYTPIWSCRKIETDKSRASIRAASNESEALVIR